MKNKNIILAISVICVGLLLAGGTYAYLSFAFNATNSTYNEKVECFDIVYDAGGNITGTLFPTAKSSDGMSGGVAMNVASTCNVSGKGTLTLTVDNATNNTLLQAVTGHCENKNTLESMTEYVQTNSDKYETRLYQTSASCTSAGGTWVTTGSALKYAVYTNSAGTGNPVAKGYITSGFKGTSTPIYTNFDVNSTQLNLYVFVWMDGWLIDNTYNSLPFSGNIHTTITQTE